MELYPQTARLVDATENSLLLRLESAKGVEAEFSNILTEINRNLDTINVNLKNLQEKSNKVPLNRRQTERNKIEQLRVGIFEFLRLETSEGVCLWLFRRKLVKNPAFPFQSFESKRYKRR